MTKRDQLLRALRSSPRDYALTARSTPAGDLHRRPTPGEWSVGDVLSHLSDVEQRYLKRLQRLIDEDNPAVPWFGPDETTHDLTASLDDLLAEFTRRREDTLDFLSALKPGQWQRPAVHRTLGPTTLRFLVQYLLEHDIEHLNQIIDIQQQFKAARRSQE